MAITKLCAFALLKLGAHGQQVACYSVFPRLLLVGKMLKKQYDDSVCKFSSKK